MKHFLFAILLLMGVTCFAQDYKAQIAEFRKGYINDFLKDKDSPLKKDDLQFLRFYDADSTYRVVAKVETLLNTPNFIMSAFTGTSGDYTRYAILKFKLNGKQMQLTVYRGIALSKINGYKDYLFLPFTDDTNGKTTYTGGRYIDLREGDFKEGNLVLDFNRAYNPYCAFGAGYTCPKPPDENQLHVAIQAGEKLFARANNH
jgi:uncharacterized protein (DUF1684 family)